MSLKSEIDHSVLLVGFTVPDDVMEDICRSDRFMPIQTHKFSWSLVRGLESNGLCVDLISAQPVGTYPSNPNILFKYTTWDRGNCSINIMLPFVNLFALKHITRFFSCMLMTGRWVSRVGLCREKTIIIHGVHSPFLYAVLIIKLVSKSKVLVIFTDPPGVPLPDEFILTKLFRKIDIFVIKYALKLMNGLIVLTRYLSEDYAPQVPSIIVEGIIDSERYNNSKETDCEEQQSVFTIVYAGGLEPDYGVELLIQAFSYIKDTSIRLVFYGKGSYSNQLISAAKIDHRIIVNEFVPAEKVGPILRNASVLINPRLSNKNFTRYSFPSKLMEYLASGRPVITTRLSSIPNDYFDYMYFIDDESPEGLANMLVNIRAKSSIELKEFGSSAREFVLTKKNHKVQGMRIVDFILHLL